MALLLGSSVMSNPSLKKALKEALTSLTAAAAAAPAGKASYAHLLRLCGDAKAIAELRQLHRLILVRGGQSNSPFLANLLVQMYGKCGALRESRSTFDTMPSRNLFSWNIMISAYAQNGHPQDALDLFRKMLSEGVSPDKFTFLPVLSSAGTLRALADGKRCHTCVDVCGLLQQEGDVSIGIALLSMYAKCGDMESARAVFDGMRRPRGVVAWTILISAEARGGHSHEALELVRQMVEEGVEPNEVTFISIFDACASGSLLKEGRQFHKQLIDSKIELEFEAGIAVKNALINMYGKCNSLKDAQLVFDGMRGRNVISWTAMTAAFAQNGYSEEALELYQEMLSEGIPPDKVTFLAALDACANLASLDSGRDWHARIVSHGSDCEITVSTALVSMYGRCGSPLNARKVFDGMSNRNLISWNSMIAAYARNGYGQEALDLLHEMNIECIKPDKVTFLSALEACSNSSSLKNGRELHEMAELNGFLDDDRIRTALLNMYGKCGRVGEAWGVFNKISQHGLISWSAMITAFSQNGHSLEALELFRQMELQGVKPNWVTFLSVLHACSHAGLLDEGWRHFLSIERNYGIKPSIDLFVCMIDLLGRAGELGDAEDLIANMPNQSDALIWTTLLGACRIHGDVDRGERAARHALELDPKAPSPYILLSNIYAAAGRWDDVMKVRKAMEERGLKKLPGCSWIEVGGQVHGFLVGDTSHPRSDEISVQLQRLNERMREVGYVPDTKPVLHDVEEEEKERRLWYHSERLAVGFGLVSTPARSPLHIVKNLRVCSDCHTAIKFISKIVGREITLRDANRYHHFKNGTCSCGEYW